MYHSSYYKSPIGWIVIKSDGDYINSIEFADAKEEELEIDEVSQHCIKELTEYFEGERNEFSVPVKFFGTPFQEEVWDKLSAIPFGRTKSYKDIALKLGSHKLSRAVGQTNSLNPIAIIVPCHRVIGSDGSLTGYAGGIKRKKWLLEFEQKIKQPELF